MGIQCDLGLGGGRTRSPFSAIAEHVVVTRCVTSMRTSPVFVSFPGSWMERCRNCAFPVFPFFPFPSSPLPFSSSLLPSTPPPPSCVLWGAILLEHVAFALLSVREDIYAGRTQLHRVFCVLWILASFRAVFCCELICLFCVLWSQTLFAKWSVF